MTVSIGIVGAGVWADRVHLPSILAHGGFEVAGVWARRPEQAQELAHRHDVPAVSDLDELLRRSDVVDFAVPPAVQPELALLAARQNRHVLLEKPVGTDLEMLARLQDEVLARRLTVVVFVNRFFDPARKATMAELAAHPWAKARSTWRSNAYRPGSPFATSWRDGDAILFDIGPHVISQLEAILGPAVHGQVTHRTPTAIDLEVHHQERAVSTARIDVAADVPALEEELTLWGADGRVDVPLLHVDAIAAFGRMLDHMARDMQEGVIEQRSSPPEAGLEVGIRTVRLLQQITSGDTSTRQLDCPCCAVSR